MSRPIVLGNGSILVCLDDCGQVRDFYFPFVGSENHVGRRDVHKIGVWVDDNFSWFSKDEWEFSLSYKKDTMVGEVKAKNSKLAVEIHFSDIVFHQKNIFLRSIKVKNNSPESRVIKIFFNQQFEISQTYYADTAYYHPILKSLIHYKGRRVFLSSARDDKGEFFSEYAAGLFNIEGKEGTWRDAEDGILSKNPIEHGAVDSVSGLTFNIEGGGEKNGYYWICAGETFAETEKLHSHLLSKGESNIIESTSSYWNEWINKCNFSFYNLSEEVEDIFKRSLFIIKTHCDKRGGILASGDTAQFQYGRDTYSYVWPRDGVFIALAMDKAGYSDISKRFYEFCSEILTKYGYVLHKYQPDKSLGSSWHPWIRDGRPQLAIQEDETALLLFGLWEHYQYSGDIEFIKKVYKDFIKKAAEFLVIYREKNTRLPYASYGLWEEQYAISTFTSSSVCAALLSAGKFAELLGEKKDAEKYFKEADIIKNAIIDNLYDKERGFFYKSLTLSNNDNELNKDIRVDSSAFCGIFRFGILPPNDPRLESMYRVVMERLSKPIPEGGVARYEGDRYHRPKNVYDDVPGNPWFVNTLWTLQYRIASANSEEELSFVDEELGKLIKKALITGVLSEQFDPYTGKQMSVAPLIWSHAEFIITVIEYFKKLEDLGICYDCSPVKKKFSA